MKKDVWDITVLEEITLRVCFDEELSKEDAISTFLDEEYSDIIDERDSKILEVKDAE